MFVLPVLCTRQSVPEGGDESFDIGNNKNLCAAHALVTALGSVGTKRGDTLFSYMQEHGRSSCKTNTMFGTPPMFIAPFAGELASHFRRAMTYRSLCLIGCKRFWTTLTSRARRERPSAGTLAGPPTAGSRFGQPHCANSEFRSPPIKPPGRL
jgi:hypothetical protein